MAQSDHGHVVELLLPLSSNNGAVFGQELFDRVRAELLERFGGVTAFSRSPAEGLWAGGENGAAKDDIVVFEVMTDTLDQAWWRDYREMLERRFEQEEIIVRAHGVQRL